jgi:hypothetical protein
MGHVRIRRFEVRGTTMKKAVAASLAVLMLAGAAVALAAPPAGKGKPAGPGGAAAGNSNGKGQGQGQGQGQGNGKSPTGPGCKPAVTVILKGTLASVPGAGTSFQLTATSGNAFGRAYVAGTQPVTILVTASTKIRREGGNLVTDLVVGDRALVQSRSCKADLAGGLLPPLTATKVIAHPVASSTTTTTTTTTESS